MTNKRIRWLGVREESRTISALLFNQKHNVSNEAINGILFQFVRIVKKTKISNDDWKYHYAILDTFLKNNNNSSILLAEEYQ